MSIGGGGSSGNSNTQTQLDPQIKQAWMDLENRAVNTAGQGAPQQQVAGFTPVELQGQQSLIDNTQPGLASVNVAAQRALALGGFQAPTIDPSSVQAGVDHYSAHDIAAPSSATLQPYMDPYTKSVYDTSLAQLDQARQDAINGNTSTATAQGGQGAWNGSRAGVSDSLTNRDFGQTAATLASTLNSNNYNQALAANRADTTNNANIENAKEQFNAGANNTASIFNAGQRLSAQQINAANSIAGDQLNQADAALLANLGGAQQTAGANAANAVLGVGQMQQGLNQQQLDAAYQNKLSSQNLPLQQIESAFGIIPSTGSGGSSVTHSSGKSGNVGF